jgi:hypothetical protein
MRSFEIELSMLEERERGVVKLMGEIALPTLKRGGLAQV